MTFANLPIDTRFRFEHYPRTWVCIKQSNQSHLSGWGIFGFDPPRTNFFGGNGCLCPLADEVIILPTKG